jgi:hypothetical protein
MFDWVNVVLDNMLQLGMSSKFLGLLAFGIMLLTLIGGIFSLFVSHHHILVKSWMVKALIVVIIIVAMRDALVAREREHTTQAAIAAGTALPDGTPLVAAPPCENGLRRVEIRGRAIAYRC